MIAVNSKVFFSFHDIRKCRQLWHCASHRFFIGGLGLMLLDGKQIRCARYIHHLSPRWNRQGSDAPNDSNLGASSHSRREKTSCTIIKWCLSSRVESTKSMRPPTIESLAWEPSRLSYQIDLLRRSWSAISRGHYPSSPIGIIVGKVDSRELMRCPKVWYPVHFSTSPGDVLQGVSR